MDCPECKSHNNTQIDNNSKRNYKLERYLCIDCGCIWSCTHIIKVEDNGNKTHMVKSNVVTNVRYEN